MYMYFKVPSLDLFNLSEETALGTLLYEACVRASRVELQNKGPLPYRIDVYALHCG